MKLFARTLVMCAVAPLLASMPAFAAEQTASISYEDLDSELMAILPPQEAMAVLPDAPNAGEEATVGAGMTGGPDHGGPGHEGPWGHRHNGMLGALQGPLAVTDDQYEKLYSLKNQYLDTVGPKALQMGQLSRKLKDTLCSSSLDAKAAADLGSRINGLKSEIAQAKMDRMIASAQVLTSDQRKALHDRMIRHAVEGGHGGMHGHHHQH